MRFAESNIALLMRKFTCIICAAGQVLVRLQCLQKVYMETITYEYWKGDPLHYFAPVMARGEKREPMHAWSDVEGVLQAAIVPAGPRRGQGTEKRTCWMATRDKFERAKHACSNSVGTSIFGHRHLCACLLFWTISLPQSIDVQVYAPFSHLEMCSGQ